MKNVARTTLAAALGIAASGTPLLAQAPAPLVLAHASATTARAVEIPAVPYAKIYNSAEASARLARADELYFAQGKTAAARREYLAVAKMQRSFNVLPTEAVWKLAGTYQAERRHPERTAELFYKHAMDAERLGDPQVQAKALLEAAVQFNKAGMRHEAHTCADRLEQLLASPHVSDTFREEVQRRIIRK